ncbi:MAG: iron chaperone [Bacteroidia bacterium]
MMQAKAESVDAYIRTFPAATQKLLKQIRVTIKKAAPKAEELISYRMPAYKLNGMLVYFAGYEHHIGFYPTASGVQQFRKEIAAYKSSKGAVQFPLDKPLPLALITRIVKFRVAENLQKVKEKKNKK